MTPEVRQRATEPFFSTKPLGKGTGLGLAQAYGIARQSGGTLRIDSAPGEGTRVRLLFPAARLPAQESRAPELVETPGPRTAGEATILVIDDDRDVRDFLSTALEGTGYRVLLARDGPEGLGKIKASAPDLVLLDYAMPIMHGAEVARTARLEQPELPIVFVTGYAETEQLEAALGQDAPVLRKPFTIAQLVTVVEQNLSNRAPKRAAR
jgi:CheY-like chemotaxis protein